MMSETEETHCVHCGDGLETALERDTDVCRACAGVWGIGL